MPNLCCALTATKLGFGECHLALTPPLRETALCHESADSGNLSSLPSRWGLGQCEFGDGRAYSHRIPLAELKCVSPKRRLEMAARLGGVPGGQRRVESPRHAYFRPLFRSGA